MVLMLVNNLPFPQHLVYFLCLNPLQRVEARPAATDDELLITSHHTFLAFRKARLQGNVR